jgi:transposase
LAYGRRALVAAANSASSSFGLGKAEVELAGDEVDDSVEVANLRELLARRDQALFGDSTEKRPQTNTSTNGRPPQKGHGPTPQVSLPIQDVIYGFEAKDLACPQCGLEASEIPGVYETSEEITVVERQFVIHKHLQKKYRCRCNAYIATAPGPQKLQPGSRYSVDFAIEVATGKYLDHAPLERQVRIMARQGLVVTSQTLWDQTQVLAHHLSPTYEAIIRKILESPVIGADETYWRLMGRKVETENKRWWA